MVGAPSRPSGGQQNRTAHSRSSAQHGAEPCYTLGGLLDLVCYTLLDLVCYTLLDLLCYTLLDLVCYTLLDLVC